MSFSCITLSELIGNTEPQHRAFVTRARLHHIALSGETNLVSDCLKGAIASVLASADLGIPCLFQAGSMQWRCVSKELDDKVNNTHFGFIWEPFSEISAPSTREIAKFVAARRRGNNPPLPDIDLPEVHCWAAWPLNKTIIDLSAGDLPRTFTRLLGAQWRAPLPPTCFIGKPDGDTCQYRADPDATVLFFALAQEMLQDIDPTLRALFVKHIIGSSGLLRE